LIEDTFYIKHKINGPEFDHVQNQCHLKNLELHHLKRSEFNLCGIFGVPVKIDVLHESVSTKKRQVLCRFSTESLQTLEKNVPANKYIFLGLRE
jgi:hypothetical protein